MSREEHYFENLLHYGHDIKGEPNKNNISCEAQTVIEMCAQYIKYTYIPSLVEDVKAELHTLWDNEPCVTEHGCDKEVYDLIDKAVKECTHDKG